MPLRTLTRNSWHVWHPVLAAAMLFGAVAACADAWSDLFTLAWRHEEFSHAVLVPLLALWLVWVRRGRLRHCTPTGGWIGLPMIVLGWAMSGFGFQNAIEVMWHGGALLVVVGAMVTVLGREVLVAFAPAWVALLFLIPVPGALRQQLTIPAQTIVAQSTAAFFELLGQPIQRSGNLLTVQGVDVAIAEACNGMRMVFALVLVSYGFAFSLPLRPYVRTLILLASPISAMVCNIIRTVPTVWVYAYWPSQADRFHMVSGWIMLFVAFALLMVMVRTLRWATVPVARFRLAYD